MSKPHLSAMSEPRPPLDCVVGLGSNLGQRLEHLEAAARLLRRQGAILAASNVYESPPLGPPQPDFLNAAVLLRTSLPPEALLAALLEIERSLGRVRRERWGPRVIDLDLLWIAGVIVHTPTLSVPHPGLSERAFAILPLLDVAPDAVDPVTGAAYRRLVSEVRESGLQSLGPLCIGL